MSSSIKVNKDSETSLSRDHAAIAEALTALNGQSASSSSSSSDNDNEIDCDVVLQPLPSGDEEAKQAVADNAAQRAADMTIVNRIVTETEPNHNDSGHTGHGHHGRHGHRGAANTAPTHLGVQRGDSMISATDGWWVSDDYDDITLDDAQETVNPVAVASLSALTEPVE